MTPLQESVKLPAPKKPKNGESTPQKIGWRRGGAVKGKVSNETRKWIRPIKLITGA